MARFAIIQGGIVANIAEAEADFAATQGWIAAPDTVAIGYLWDGHTFTAPAQVVVVPEVISPRQLRQSLTHGGYRTAVEAAVAAADQDTKDWYQTASAFERHHPLVISMAQSLNYTSAQLDAVWTYGASI